MSRNPIYLGFAETLEPTIPPIYQALDIEQIFDTTLSLMDDKLATGVDFAYFANACDYWHKPKALSIYIVDADEGRTLNLQARGKDYATNVLSYPSGLPDEVLAVMDEIEMGELILCHDVVVNEAATQHKSFQAHLTHLIIHGILHLLGFDHEISDDDADEMEGFEIEILAALGFDNPYQ
ncbi:rRNA maturation RNase YbeY [Moraxella sp. ZJ142]|uniref:rRNA maturation RNase YbeY n=1 Tax=Moraxella marmotae TaxID=3344520 RepID=UPI0035D502A5